MICQIKILTTTRDIVRVGSLSTLTKAMYFAEMKMPSYTAELIVQNPNNVCSKFYATILDLFKLLGNEFPLALTVFCRANPDLIRDRGVSKIYHHTVCYARKLDELA